MCVQRWMKRFSEEESVTEEKENRSSNSTSTGTHTLTHPQHTHTHTPHTHTLTHTHNTHPHTHSYTVHPKQRLLQRWLDRTTPNTPTHALTKPTPSHPPSLTTCTTPVDQEGRTSPLFEEFSDSEFDVSRDGRCVDGDEEEVGSWGERGTGGSETMGQGVDSSDPAHSRAVGDVASASVPASKDGPGERGVVSEVAVGDGGVGPKVVERGGDSREGVVKSETELVRKARSLEELMESDDPVSLGSLGSLGRTGGKSLEELVEMAVNEVGVEGGVRRGEGEGVFVTGDPRDQTAGQPQVKTPKRKVCVYFQYTIHCWSISAGYNTAPF